MAWARNGSCSASVEKRASSSELWRTVLEKTHFSPSNRATLVEVEPGVYGKDAHGYSPSLADAAALAASAAAARMTSMATLPSISWTGAEREKSQTGAAKPCSTGP